jgi:hypothetical protein
MVSFINIGRVRHRPVQGNPAEPAPRDRVAHLAAQALVAEPVAELEEHQPQVGLHRRRRTADPRVEVRDERCEERRIIQQRIHSFELRGKPQQLLRQHRLEQRRLIAYGTEHDGLDPF